MKKRNQLQIPAVRKETIHKILYGLMMQKAAKQKLKRPAAITGLIAVEE
jgi:hypothetical protein